MTITPTWDTGLTAHIISVISTANILGIITVMHALCTVHRNQPHYTILHQHEWMTAPVCRYHMQDLTVHKVKYIEYINGRPTDHHRHCTYTAYGLINKRVKIEPTVARHENVHLIHLQYYAALIIVF